MNLVNLEPTSISLALVCAFRIAEVFGVPLESVLRWQAGSDEE